VQGSSVIRPAVDSVSRRHVIGRRPRVGLPTRKGFELVWSPPIVAECLRVIEYPKLAGKFRTDPRVLVERAMASTHMVATDLLLAVEVVKADRSDNVHLATALAGGARWVVPGNTRHLTPLDGYAGLRIVEPAVFLAELDAQP
jgi:predicted nucleic acid-binding protein